MGNVKRMPPSEAKAPDGKTCKKCGETKPLTAFSVVWTNRDGRSGSCSDCRSAQTQGWYYANLERERAKRREYARSHRHLYRESYLRRKAADPEGFAARARENTRRHRAPIKEAGRIRREKERREYLARIAVEGKPCSRCKRTMPLSEFQPDGRYKSGRRSVCLECRKILDREWTRKRRRLMDNGKVDYAKILERDGMVCHICGGKIRNRRDLDFDHVVPLSKGGPHSEENVRPSHRRCNRRKGSRG